MTILAVFAAIVPARHSAGTARQTKPIYQSTGSEATITGKISFAGQPPQPRRIDGSADPVCEGWR